MGIMTHSLCTAQENCSPSFPLPPKLPKGELISGAPETGSQSCGEKMGTFNSILNQVILNYLKGSEEEKDINPDRLLVCSIAQC